MKYFDNKLSKLIFIYLFIFLASWKNSFFFIYIKRHYLSCENKKRKEKKFQKIKTSLHALKSNMDKFKKSWSTALNKFEIFLTIFEIT